MVRWPAMPLLKPFRALRYDVGAAGPLDDLVAPPYDVITPEMNARLLARSPWNAVRLVRPDQAEDAARALAEWQGDGILVREEQPAVWLLEEEFTGPDGVRRTRRGIAARARLEPYSGGLVLPHEGTFAEPKQARLELMRATRTKMSPILMLHHGTAPTPSGEPMLTAELDGRRQPRLAGDRPDGRRRRAGGRARSARSSQTGTIATRARSASTRRTAAPRPRTSSRFSSPRTTRGSRSSRHTG